MITKAIVEANYTAMRSALNGATVSVRHNATEYTGTRVATIVGQDIGPQGRGMRKTVMSAVRLLVSEIVSGPLEVGDTFEIQGAFDWEQYAITGLRYDNALATVLVEYGERYG